LRVQLHRAGRKSSGPLGDFEHLFSGLNALFGLKDTEKVECAEFDNPCAVAHNNAPENRGFFA